MLSWRELIVWDGPSGQEAGTLGDFVENCPANLDNMTTITNGRITEWPGYFIGAPGEDADWDSPRGEVDWTGFEDALVRVRGTA